MSPGPWSRTTHRGQEHKQDRGETRFEHAGLVLLYQGISLVSKEKMSLVVTQVKIKERLRACAGLAKSQRTYILTLASVQAVWGHNQTRQTGNAL